MKALTKAEWQRMRPASAARTSWPTLAVLGADAVLFALASALFGRGVLLSLCAWLLFTLALVHLYIVDHECVHRAVFANAKANRWLGHLLGFALLYPFLQRRRSHLEHHAFAGSVTRDPASARAAARFASLSPRALVVLDVMWRCGVPFLALNERVGLWLDPFYRTHRSAAARAERRAGLLYAAGYATLACLLVRHGALGLGLTLYLPALGALLFVEELINLPHHLHDSVRPELSPLWEQTVVTHSCADLPLWSKVVLLHFNLHSAHHVFPEAPWHALPALERALVSRGLVRRVEHELRWSLRERRTSFREAFRDYFTPESGARARSNHEFPDTD